MFFTHSCKFQKRRSAQLLPFLHFMAPLGWAPLMKMIGWCSITRKKRSIWNWSNRPKQKWCVLSWTSWPLPALTHASFLVSTLCTSSTNSASHLLSHSSGLRFLDIPGTKAKFKAGASLALTVTTATEPGCLLLATSLLAGPPEESAK